jgi:hypothetical protein
MTQPTFQAIAGQRKLTTSEFNLYVGLYEKAKELITQEFDVQFCLELMRHIDFDKISTDDEMLAVYHRFLRITPGQTNG